MKRNRAVHLILMISVFVSVFGTGDLAAGLSAVSLSVSRTILTPGEEFTVSFSATPALPGDAWIGIVPSAVPHGSETVNDQNDLTYQYVQGRTSGTMAFRAPMAPGSYDMRMNDTDNNGREVAFVTVTVAGQAAQPVQPIQSQGEATLRLERNSFRPGESIRVIFTAPGHYAADAWVGLIPSQTPHGSEAVNDQHDMTYQYVSKRTSGEMLFNAPGEAGTYDFRMNDTDNNGREVASVTFTVSAPAAQPAQPQGGEATLRLEQTNFRPGEAIRVFFTAPGHYAANAWVGIIPSQFPHGSEAVNDQHDTTYQYVSKRTSGEMIFNAPGQAGTYDLRMNDTDDNGREVATVTFFVY